MRPCLQKFDTGFWTYGFVSLSLVLNPKTTFLQHVKYFLQNSAKFCIIFPKIGLNLDQSYEGLSLENYNKPSKIMVLVLLQI